MIIDKAFLDKLGVDVIQSITHRIRSQQINPKTDKEGTTLVRSSHLIRSIRHLATNNSIMVGTNLIYARILHEGGVITPKRAKYLAIPISPLASVHKPRDFSDTFISKGIIFQKQEDGEPLPLYVLKKQVTIPARPYMFIDTPTRDKLVMSIANHVAKHIVTSVKGS